MTIKTQKEIEKGLKLQTRMRRIQKIDQAINSLMFTVNALADYWAMLSNDLRHENLSLSEEEVVAEQT